MSSITLLKTVLLDQFRQEFAAFVEKIRSTVGVRLPTWLNWTVAILLQNTILLFICTFIEDFRGTSLWLPILVVVLGFTILVSISMARRNALRVSSHPLQWLIRQSPQSQGTLILIWLIGETCMFWIHELVFTGTSLFVLAETLPSWGTTVIGVLAWGLFISYLYLATLYKKVFSVWRATMKQSLLKECFYIIRLGIVSLLIFFVARDIFDPTFTHPFSSNGILTSYQRDIDHVFHFIKLPVIHLYMVLYRLISSSVWTYVGVVLAMLILYGMGIAVRSHHYILRTPSATVHLGLSGTITFQLFHAINRWIMRSNIRIEKDLIILERIQIHTSVSSRMPLIFPPVIASVLAFMLLFVHHMPSQSLTNCFWYFTVFSTYQTAWHWLWSYPILHPSSELRQVDLTYLSPNYTVKHLMYSKTALLLVLSIPYQLILTLIYTMAIVLSAGTLTEWIFAVGGQWLICLSISVLSSWWTFKSVRYDFPNVLSIRIDTYESRLVSQFYKIPKRMITLFFSVGLFMAMFSDHVFDGKIQIVLSGGIIVMSVVSAYLLITIKGERRVST